MPPEPPPLKPSQFNRERHNYIPPRVEKIMARKKDSNFPFLEKHKDPYAKQDEEQPLVATESVLSQSPPSPSPQPGQTVNPNPQTQAEPQAGAPSNEYDFITNPEQPALKRSLPSLPGISPTAMRAVFAAGGLFVLVILFVIIKGALSGTSNLTLFIGVAQDQQELIHLAINTSQQQGLAVDNQDFAATAKLSLGSSQSAVVNYLANNGQKVDLKKLSLKVSTATDSQLTTAAAATTYDQTFQEIMKAKLTTYISDIQQTYQQTKGKKGRALLNDSYNQAQLLLSQLNTPASSP